ncbi:formylglycine-generating enzyme family protein [Salinispira pacifica]|uniref:Serine/threonine kinase n=1 Tax=Salinispira pacifica TaxID=1307761 RepID=V5WJB2_9SPIO|nr:SUMF1/EgtB/PvdO family nonheme iron enzyme [Salinispira pacifica]AHC15634.1 serine/threonine kinase [Salinispira pacifica]
MKRSFPFFEVIAVVLMMTAVFPASATPLSAGDTETYTAGGVSFVMSYVPGGMTFPTGVNDDGSATVDNAYWIGETEVTYELWDTVYTWATSKARGAKIYGFANAGRQGGDLKSGPIGTNQHPVTTVNWRDAMVWCNALTEWYNAQNGTSYDHVYSYGGSIIRDSRDATACEAAVESSTAKGFRLLSRNEYELAARYRNGTDWTYGDHASGDESGACFDDGSILGDLGMSTVIGDYAVYRGNSGLSTAVVKSKTANALGLYDMSGNVAEWCFTKSGSRQRGLLGGSCGSSAGGLQVGAWSYYYPGEESPGSGFRIARTAD